MIEVRTVPGVDMRHQQLDPVTCHEDAARGDSDIVTVFDRDCCIDLAMGID